MKLYAKSDFLDACATMQLRDSDGIGYYAVELGLDGGIVFDSNRAIPSWVMKHGFMPNYTHVVWLPF